jgi:hypothetical protein
MAGFEDYRKMVIGKTLTNLFHTKQDGPHDYMPGISPAYYFSTVMELDHVTKLRFGNDFVVESKDEELLITLTNESWALPRTLLFKGQKIIDLTKDEYDQLTFHLENGTTIAHTVDYGDQLFIENPNVIEYKGQDNDRQVAATQGTFPKAGPTWWQKLFGS